MLQDRASERDVVVRAPPLPAIQRVARDAQNAWPLAVRRSSVIHIGWFYAPMLMPTIMAILGLAFEARIAAALDAMPSQ
jgi:hypothetical protein